MSIPSNSNKMTLSPGKAKVALFWMNLANEPFVSLYALLLFILRKDLGATALEIAIFVTLRPVISVFSFYWSANLRHQKSKLVSNMAGAWILARLPFLLLPWFHSIGYVIFASAIYQLFYRAGMPALMEILKIHIPKDPREKFFSLVYVLSFVESVVLAFFLGKVLDYNHSSWTFLFFLTALLAICTVFIQLKVPVPAPEKQKPKDTRSLVKKIVDPWRDMWSLLKARPDFAQFQWGFMMGGSGLMIIAPALAFYYADVLALSHENITTARCIWMSFGVVISSALWRRAIRQISIPKLTSMILIGFAFFPLVLLFAKIHMYWLFVAFFIYGVAQAGSHLLWHLSGTLFCQEEDSSQFSAVNILMVGIRGAIFPVIGGILCQSLGPVPVLVVGVMISLVGAWYMMLGFKKQRHPILR